MSRRTTSTKQKNRVKPNKLIFRFTLIHYLHQNKRTNKLLFSNCTRNLIFSKVSLGSAVPATMKEYASCLVFFYLVKEGGTDRRKNKTKQVMQFF